MRLNELMSQIGHILFDLDGTLIDTEPTAARAVRGCFHGWGVEVSAEDAQYVTGRTWAVALNYLFSRYRLPVPEEQASSQVIRTYRELLEQELVVVPGSVDAVRALAGEFRLALVSGSSRSEIVWALDTLGIRSHFEVILGAEDYPHSKPAPDGYVKAMGILRADPACSLVFEDSTAGIASARAARTRVVAITGTNHFQQNTGAADWEIPDLRGVGPAWIRDFERRVTG